ncbi:MAG: hypothetical protein ACOYNF_18890 [Rhodoferax sp.]
MSELNQLPLHKVSANAQQILLSLSGGQPLVLTADGNMQAPWIQDVAEHSPNTLAELAVLVHSLKSTDGTGRTFAMPSEQQLAQSVQQHRRAVVEQAAAVLKAELAEQAGLDPANIYKQRAGQLQQSAPGIDFASIYQRRAAGF